MCSYITHCSSYRWLIIATATVAGSTCSFITSRTIFSGYVHRLVAQDKRFEAFSSVLKHDGIKLLIMIRLCPLPYSISNGAISTFPTVTPRVFALATAVATPKLIIPIFIGTRMAAIARSGEKMDASSKAINWISIIGGIIFGVVTGSLIYMKYALCRIMSASLADVLLERLRVLDNWNLRKAIPSGLAVRGLASLPMTLKNIQRRRHYSEMIK